MKKTEGQSGLNHSQVSNRLATVNIYEEITDVYISIINTKLSPDLFFRHKEKRKCHQFPV